MKSTSRSREVGQDRREIAGLLEHRARRRAHRHAQLVGDDVGERRLAEPGRAVQQHVIERLAALPGGGNRDLQVLADAILADVVVERARAQARFVLRVLVDARGGDEAVVGHRQSQPHAATRSTDRLSRQLPQRLLQRALEVAVGRRP